ncbi:leucine--tRNA ligase, mitochondrial-like [Uranotaenia lowii]|uniref:leucine--tRNA ligase, mitochondrial-like n=1 Tax=Uranotaenia lowii TaxID=190385 RepID=UPI00247A8666|nr:leucine--tRNA ligase, mitochondrial-like [Uranotaenia lowii]
MMLMMLNSAGRELLKRKSTTWIRQCYSSADLLSTKELTSDMKLAIEKKWHNNLGDYRFDPASSKPKRYVLAMFPYPSGNLHMGHVRVYTISDAMARFYRFNGANVLHPMGWDAFGLPAENAAMQRKIPADRWTRQNIDQMRQQLEKLQFSFDWDREFATCDPKYYRWTQKLFLMLFEDGLAYQKEAQVNWDPVDMTVLADEQVDNNGYSWRSGAKVEKRVLRQWFIKTTQFAKPLYEGLSDPILEDWKDIINLQKHWIGECSGYLFDLKSSNKNETLPIWTENPENLKHAIFVAVKPSNLINSDKKPEGPLESYVENFLTGDRLPIIITEKVDYPEGCDSYLGLCSNEADVEIAKRFNCPVNNYNRKNVQKEEIVKLAHESNRGGYPVSSKLRDWLISRQRFWGTPIPIIHCNNCGPVPVPDSELPVALPLESVGMPLSKNDPWRNTTCPKCNSTDAQRETDTMDTFVDSSWYFLRFVDPKNTKDLFDHELSRSLMPVDLYVGGKEHAVLHMYYARFMNYYLYSKGLVPHPEPFKRLLVQGMVMGRSFRLKGSGKYIPASEVRMVDEKKNKAIHVPTGDAVVCLWEKMSKSKLNGVDPLDVLREHGCDTLRLILLADVAPTSHRNWSEATFPGVLNWLRRIWMTMHDLRSAREAIGPETKAAPDTEEFRQQDSKLWDARNYFSAGATFNFKFSHQLSVGISKMQGLTNAIRRSDSTVMAYSPQYERSIAAQIIMLAPMAPHFASELWQHFVALPHRLNKNSDEIQWDRGLFDQNWPVIDEDYALDLTFKVNGYESCILKIPTKDLNQLTHQQSLDMALEQNAVTSYIGRRKIRSSDFVLYPGCEAILSITLEQLSKEDKLELEQLGKLHEKAKSKDKSKSKKPKKQKQIVEL